MAPVETKKRKLAPGAPSRAGRPAKRLRNPSRFDSDSDSATPQPSKSTSTKSHRATTTVARPDTVDDERKGSPGRTIDSDEVETNGSSNEEEDDEDVDMSDESATSSRPEGKRRKRNDPEAFATSISKILGSKLSTSKRADPVLARSKDAATAKQEIADARLEVKAKQKLREDKKAELDRGRIKDVLGGGEGGGLASVGETMELEKRLRRTAQRGVIKLFNAVRAAQVQADQAAREAKKAGIVGVTRREERVTEMSKKGFLDLVAAGGQKTKPAMEGS